MPDVVCVDSQLHGHRNSIAAYFVQSARGLVVVDPGPGSTLPKLVQALQEHGFRPQDVTDVLLTHIHLDHAGAAGWLARQGARIHVHPLGAPHMLNPEKLLASARRIYGDAMEETWGEFLPVPESQLSIVQDGQTLSLGGLDFTALHTPGHAEHHAVYILDDLCFGGDIGGVRRPGPVYLRLPFVPPETHLGKWRESLQKIQACGVRRMAVTHFGIYEDAPRHIELALRFLNEVEAWLEQVMPSTPDVETLLVRYTAWLHENGQVYGADDETLTTYDFASPVKMGASGLFRYWHKVRLAGN
jgi:glyoxylase-like metal-dependent hydrolase (beta-lactamase superfamily II)